MTCAQCGNPVEASTRFCGACGTAVVQQPLAPTEQIPALTVAMPTTASIPPDDSTRPRYTPPVDVPILTAAPPVDAAFLPSPSLLQPPPSADGSDQGGPPQGAGPLPPRAAEARASKGKQRVQIVATLAAIAVAMAAGTYVVRGRLGLTGGAGKPSEAASGLLKAMVATDPIAAMSALDPNETRGTASAVKLTLRRLSEAKLGGKTDAFSGLDMSLTEVRFHDVKLGEGVVKVVLDGGRLEMKAQPDQLSPLAKALFRVDGRDVTTRTIQLGAVRLPSTRGDRGEPPSVVTVKHGRRWYVSPLLTGVEYISSRSYDARTPVYSAPPATGSYEAKTPTMAVQRLTDAGSDVERVAAALPAAEGRAVRALASAFSPALAQLQSVRLNISTLGDEPAKNGRRIVRVSRATASFSARGEDGGSSGTVQLDRDCVTLDGQRPACANDLARKLGVDGLTLVTVKESGQWRVSLIETAMRYVETALERVTAAQVQRFTAGALGATSVLGAVAPALELDATGGKGRISLNDGGFVVAGIRTKANVPFGLAVDSSSNFDLTQAFDSTGKEWAGDNSVLMPGVDGLVRLVFTGEPNATAELTISPVAVVKAELGAVVRGVPGQFMLLELPADVARDNLQYEANGVQSSQTVPDAASWELPDGGRNRLDAASSAPAVPEPTKASSKLALTPNSPTEGWTFSARKPMNQFTSGGVRASGEFDGTPQTHDFIAAGGKPVAINLETAWDGWLTVSCSDSGEVSESDNLSSGGVERVTLFAAPSNRTCTLRVGTKQSDQTGPYIVTLE